MSKFRYRSRPTTELFKRAGYLTELKGQNALLALVAQRRDAMKARDHYDYKAMVATKRIDQLLKQNPVLAGVYDDWQTFVGDDLDFADVVESLFAWLCDSIGPDMHVRYIQFGTQRQQ